MKLGHCHPDHKQKSLSHLRAVSEAEEGNGSTEWSKVRAPESDCMVPVVPFTTCVTVDKLLNFSAPRFLYLQNWSSNNIHLKGLGTLNAVSAPPLLAIILSFL